MSQTLEQRIASLAHWRVQDKALHRTVELKSYVSGLALVQRIGLVAERINHHPDMTLSWGKLVISLTTHDAGRMTDLDVKLAQEIDAIVAE